MFLPITMLARPTCPSCQKFNACFEKNWRGPMLMNSYIKVYITNFQYHKFSIKTMLRSKNNMSTQNLWASKCKHDTKKNVYYFYINNVFFSLTMF
jgi:hypothetical protein